MIKNTLSTKYKMLLFCAVFTLFCWVLLGVLEICKGDVNDGILDLFLILPVPLMLAALKNPKLPLAVPIAVLGGFVAAMFPLMTFPRLSAVLEWESDMVLAINLLSGYFSLGMGVWGSITAYHWIKERLLVTLSEQDWHHTIKIGSLLIRKTVFTNIIDTKEAKIIEINKKSWDFITEPDAPDFAQKFDNLIKAYFNNAYLDKERFPNRGEIKFFLETLVQDNWLCKMPFHVPVFTYLKEIIKHTGEVEMIRLSCFWHCMEIINLIQDYYNYFGESESSEKTLIQAYAMLLKAHRKGFEAEKR